MEILEPVNHGSAGAVFTVVVDGVRMELPWVDHAQLRDGVLVLSAAQSGSGQASATFLREFAQAAWQTAAGSEDEGASGSA